MRREDRFLQWELIDLYYIRFLGKSNVIQTHTHYRYLSNAPKLLTLINYQ